MRTLPPAPICEVVGCERLHAAHGLCQRHYQRERKHGPIDRSIPDRPVHTNPWSGLVACPRCNSAEWTLPFRGSLDEETWLCLACDSRSFRRTSPASLKVRLP